MPRGDAPGTDLSSLWEPRRLFSFAACGGGECEYLGGGSLPAISLAEFPGLDSAVKGPGVSRRKTAIVRTLISLYNPRFPGVPVKSRSGIPQWFFVLVPKPSWLKSPSVAPSVEKSCVPRSAARPATWFRKTKDLAASQHRFLDLHLHCGRSVILWAARRFFPAQGG